MTSKRSRYDVVVVGGRVAGSATAMLLARLGHDVVVVDQASFPSDTISTHSIARSGVVQLQRWVPRGGRGGAGRSSCAGQVSPPARSRSRAGVSCDG